MKLATLRTPRGTVAVRVDTTTATEIDGVSDVGALLARPDWRQIAAAGHGTTHDLDHLDYGPVVPNPGKILCVGLNYRNHIVEMGRDLPAYPTLFAKFAETLTGPYDDIVMPSETDQLDWEGELAVVIGRAARRVPQARAADYIAGYSVLNDVTVRDYQYRTEQWHQGKIFQATSPFGPVLVTADELPDGATLTTRVDHEVVQKATIDDLVFTPEHLVAYISAIVTLNPGDVISTGTPGGVGHARQPARYLAAGSRLSTGIDGIGELTNTVVADAP